MYRVAAYLGNTPAVARKSYIDPRVLDSWASGEAAEALAAASVVSRAGGATALLAQDLEHGTWKHEALPVRIR